MPTKTNDIDPQLAELLERVAKLEEENQKKDLLLQEKEEQVKKLQAKGAGYLITTPNANYDGETYGVQFVNGQAFIPVGSALPYFVEVFGQPMKDEYFDKQLTQPNMTERMVERIKAEEKAVRTREAAFDPVLKAAQVFEKDMGYTVEFFESTDEEALQKRLSRRARERAEIIAAQEKLEQAQQMMTPHRR